MRDYTDEQLDTIDRLVAEKVMGLKVYFRPGPTMQIPCPENRPGCLVWHGRAIPHYSTDFTATLEVAEKMREIGKDLDFARELAGILALQGHFKLPGQVLWNLFYGLETAPLAICRAALKAVREVG